MIFSSESAFALESSRPSASLVSNLAEIELACTTYSSLLPLPRDSCADKYCFKINKRLHPAPFHPSESPTPLSVCAPAFVPYEETSVRLHDALTAQGVRGVWRLRSEWVKMGKGRTSRHMIIFSSQPRRILKCEVL